MTDSMILLVGIFAFVMAVTGVAFTVIEFKRNILPTAKPGRRPPQSSNSSPEHAHP